MMLRPDPNVSINFVRDTLLNHKTRLDGRGMRDFRAVHIEVNSKVSGRAEVLLGKTRYVDEKRVFRCLNYLFILKNGFDFPLYADALRV